MTERTRVVFRVKKSASGDFWICLEPFERNLKVLGNGFFGLRLARRNHD